MTPDPDEVVTVFSGTLVEVEAYQQALADAGIESKLTGDSLLLTFGSAIPGAIELYVHRRDFDKAVAAIQRYDEERKEGGEPHPRPKDDANPTTEKHHQTRHIPPHQSAD